MLSLWLMPDQNTHQQLLSLIKELAEFHDQPLFEPHVTLLTGITDDRATAIKKCNTLVSKQRTLNLRLTDIEYLDLYYRCLFFKTSETTELLSLREKAKELFEEMNIEPFIPHVSFLYGNIPEFQKLAIIKKLGDRFQIEFSMPKLRLVETPLLPDSWKLVEEFALN